MDRLDVVLADLGRTMGIDDVAFTDDECRLVVGDRSVEVVADRKRGRIVLSALVADVPPGERADVLAYLLDLNTGPALGGSVLGVPAESDAVLLTDQFAADDLSAPWLNGRVRSFLDALDLARSLLLESRSLEPDEGPAPPAGPMIRV